MEHVPTRETPINHRVHRNKESVAKEGTVIDRCKKKKKKKKRILFVRNSHQFHPTAIFPAREHFPSPPRPFFRESREQSRSHTSPIPSLPLPSKLVLVQPQPWSIAPSSSPFSFCASRRGACARKRREASASCRGRRTNVVGQPTDRPSRPSVLLSARPVSSREPSRGLFQSFHPQSAPTLLFPIPSVHNTHRTQRPAAPRARVSPLREAACSSTAARPSPPRVGRRKMGRTPRATRAGSIAK